MSFGEWDDKSADAGELRVESKSMFASQEPALRVRKAFRTDSPKKNGLRRLGCSRPCPQASRPGCLEAPGRGLPPATSCSLLHARRRVGQEARPRPSTPTPSSWSATPSLAPRHRERQGRAPSTRAVLSLERVRRREASRRGASRLQKLIWSSCGSSAAHGACVLRLLAA